MRCQWCEVEEAVAKLNYDSMNGPASLNLCHPCTAARALNPYGRNFEMNGVTTTTEEILENLPKNRKCSGCGVAVTGGHWHFLGQKIKKVDRSGRAYFCPRDTECCPKCDPVLDWDDEDEDFDWDDDDEFIFD